MGVTPRKCSPMTMMTIPATFPSTYEYARSNAPMTLALAPSATNTVVKPSTNSSAAAIVSRRTCGSAFGTGEPFDRCSGEVDEIGRHQRQHAGRQEAQHAGKQRGRDGNIGHGALMPTLVHARKPAAGQAARM